MNSRLENFSHKIRDIQYYPVYSLVLRSKLTERIATELSLDRNDNA